MHELERRPEILALAAPVEAPALRPAPRKLKRRTEQPIRASALAAWYATFVCMVPPYEDADARTPPRRGLFLRPTALHESVCVGAAPRRLVEQRLEVPAGPGISRSMVLLPNREGELIHKRRETIGPGHATNMAGALERDAARAGNQWHVRGRGVWRDDKIETGIAAHHQRWCRHAEASRAKSTVAMSSARSAMRPSITGARTAVFSCHAAKRSRARRPGIALADLPTQPPRRFGKKRGSKQPRKPRVKAVSVAQVEAGSRSRSEHECRRPFRPLRRET